MTTDEFLQAWIAARGKTQSELFHELNISWCEFFTFRNYLIEHGIINRPARHGADAIIPSIL